jgi:hypothetical protein
MKNKGTIGLAAAVILLSLYAYFVEFKGKEKEQVAKDQQSLILNGMNPDQINFIEINNLQQKFTLNRSTEGWSLSSPISDAADSTEMENWLRQLTEEKTMSVAVEAADIKWGYYGFDKPVKTITIKTNSNAQVTVEVSEKKNFEGNSFIRFPGVNKVLVAGPEWPTHVGKSLLNLRNKSIFRHQISNVQGIQIKNQKNLIKIENKDAKWVASEAPDLILDQNGVRDLVAKINGIKAIEFVGEKETLASSKKNLKLGSSAVTVDVKLSDGAWSAMFYQAADKSVYVEVPKTEMLVKISTEHFDKLSALTLSSLRDYHLPFAKFDRNAVEKLSYETSLKKAGLVKKGQTWELDPPDSVNEVQQDKVQALLEVIKNLVAREYAAKNDLKKDISKQKITFKDATDKVHFEMQFSDSEQRKIGTEEKTIRFAKTNLYPEMFIMDESEFEKLNLNDIIKIKVSNEGKALPVDNKKEEKNAK